MCQETVNIAMPKVSVLILTRNRIQTLKPCIESVSNQSYKNKEIIVVENASSDGTFEMLRDFYPSISVIRTHKNLGCPSGRNLGIANCSGRYVYLLDDDGWLDPDALTHAVARAETDESISVVMSRIDEIENDQIVRSRPENLQQFCYISSFVGAASMLRREHFDHVGCFPDDFGRQAEEEDLAIRMLNFGGYCVFEPKSIMFHVPLIDGKKRTGDPYIYLSLRNTNKTSLRLWPFPWCFYKVVINFLYAFKYGIIMRKPLLPIRLLRDLICDLSNLHGQRNPVRSETLRVFRRLAIKPSFIKPFMQYRFSKACLSIIDSEDKIDN